MLNLKEYMNELEHKNNNEVRIKLTDLTCEKIKKLQKQNIPMKKLIEEMVDNYIYELYEKMNDE